MQIKIMTFNIHHGEGTDQRIDLDRQAAIIQKSQAEIVFLQEVDKDTRRSYGLDEAKVLSNKSGFEYYVFGKNMDFDGGEYGNAILSQFQLEQPNNYSLPQPLFPGGHRESRGLLQVEVIVNKAKFVLLGTHFSLYERERLIQVDFVLKIINQVSASVPIILAGDLNCSETSKEISKISQCLTDTYKVTNHNLSSSNRIDYIFFRGPYRITAFADIQTVASDHNPLVATFSSNP
ncbi:MAG: endonuclease/exonuclease/phosphatase family protein [Ktedonobacteraceae bacterium]|nr:endonuclease/exonuclease/phosphatase family protein [Ktedonobacteraceae bacterium]